MDARRELHPRNSRDPEKTRANPRAIRYFPKNLTQDHVPPDQLFQASGDGITPFMDTYQDSNLNFRLLSFKQRHLKEYFSEKYKLMLKQIANDVFKDKLEAGKMTGFASFSLSSIKNSVLARFPGSRNPGIRS